jgi:hypothetical protein
VAGMQRMLVPGRDQLGCGCGCGCDATGSRQGIMVVLLFNVHLSCPIVRRRIGLLARADAAAVARHEVQAVAVPNPSK